MILSQCISQGVARNQWHRHISVATCLAHVQHPYNRRVIETGRGSGFALKTRQYLSGRLGRRHEYLERHNLTLGIAASIDRGNAATAQRVFNLVGSQFLAGQTPCRHCLFSPNLNATITRSPHRP